MKSSSAIGIADVACQIMSNLKFKELRKVRLVCKTWNNFLESQPKLWLTFLNEDIAKMKSNDENSAHLKSMFLELSKILEKKGSLEQIFITIAEVRHEICNRLDYIEKLSLESFILGKSFTSDKKRFREFYFFKMLLDLDIFNDSIVKFEEYLAQLAKLTCKLNFLIFLFYCI